MSILKDLLLRIRFLDTKDFFLEFSIVQCLKTLCPKKSYLTGIVVSSRPNYFTKKILIMYYFYSVAIKLIFLTKHLLFLVEKQKSPFDVISLLLGLTNTIRAVKVKRLITTSNP